MTVTPTAPPAALETIQQAATGETPSGFFSNAGKVAGVFVAVALIILGIFVAVIWCTCCRGRRRTTDESTAGDGDDGRRPSKMSQLGFSVTRRSGDWKNLSRNSTVVNSAEEKSPVDTITPVSQRASGPLRVIDQRLDPNTLWNIEHQNGSHASIGSFRDDQDYSRRMLRVCITHGEETAWTEADNSSGRES